MPLEAGKRDRMVWVSFHNMIHDALEQLGWFDDPVALNLPRQPVYMPFGGFADDVKTRVNGIVVMPEDTTYFELETGSHSMQGDRVFIIDVYAEDHAVGIHLRGDISAILRGHHPTVGRDRNILDVIDEDTATPYVAATLDIENVRDNRGVASDEPWERYWYSLLCVLEDPAWVGA